MAPISEHQKAFKPAERISRQGDDVWSMVNSAAAASPVQPIANLGQGFFGYNPPATLLNAAKEALNRVDCNQYSPTKGRPRLKKALATTYAPLLGKSIDPETEIAITTGANEGMLCAMMAFVEPGDEVVVFEPFFDQYIPNIELVGATVKGVPLSPPPSASTKKTAASDWVFDIDTLRQAVTPKTKMVIVNSPQNPLGKVFTREELFAIGEICVKNSVIILSDEVYDRLSYVTFTRIATLSPEISAHVLTVGSVGKAFYATGWRVGFLIGPETLIKHISTTHTRICYATPGPPQEAAAVGYEEADSENFWEISKNDIQGKMHKFNAIWDELGLPYIEPEGGYFVLVNTSKIHIPEEYVFPTKLQDKPRDYKLSWFLIQEFGVAAIPTSDFYQLERAHLAKDYLRFAVCKNDDVLELAKERLRGLGMYLRPRPFLARNAGTELPIRYPANAYNV